MAWLQGQLGQPDRVVLWADAPGTAAVNHVALRMMGFAPPAVWLP